MLPDFPSIKAELINLISKRLRHRVRTGDPVLAMITHTVQHEGDRRAYGTVEGDRKEVDYKKIESILSVSRSELKSLTVEDIIRQVDAAADELTGHMARTVFATVEQITNEAGAAVDAGGKPLTFETFSEALDRIRIDFDEETRQPLMPTLVMGPDLFAKVKEKIPEWEKNQEEENKNDQK